MRAMAVQLNRRARRDAVLKHQPFKLVLTYRWDDVDQDGNVLKRGREHRSRSYLIAWIYALMINWSSTNTAPTQINDTAASSWSLGYNSNGSFQINPGSGDSSVGVVVGSGGGSVPGTNAPTPTDYKLQTQILNGTAANTLVHGTNAVGTPTSDATRIYLTLSRLFTNNSPTNPITIYETGIYVKHNTTSGVKIFCMVRDKLGTGVSIANGGASKTLTYTLALTT